MLSDYSDNSIQSITLLKCDYQSFFLFIIKSLIFFVHLYSMDKTKSEIRHTYFDQFKKKAKLDCIKDGNSRKRENIHMEAVACFSRYYLGEIEKRFLTFFQLN